MRAISTALLIAAASCGAAWAQTVGRTYAVSGTNPDASTYTGTVNITLSGAACQISWNVGSTPATGNCLLSGTALASFDKPGVGTEILTPRR